MLHAIAPLFSGLLLILFSGMIGVIPIKKLIMIQEAKHELKHGSAGFLRTTMGWINIAIWIAATWYFATIIGDWYVSGDLGDAIGRSFQRLEIILHILSALSND